MSNGMSPLVRSLILCEDILTDPDNPRRVSLLNLVQVIRSVGELAYPLVQPELCVFAQLVGGRGTGTVEVRIESAESGGMIFQTRPRSLTFPNDPLAVYGLRFRIRNCSFPTPGLYWVQLRYNDQLLGQQPLILR